MQAYGIKNIGYSDHSHNKCGICGAQTISKGRERQEAKKNIQKEIKEIKLG